MARPLHLLSFLSLVCLTIILLPAQSGVEAVSVWGSGDVSQKALWDDYAAAYLSHKDSIEMLFITDTGASGLSRFTGGGVVYTVLGAVLTPNITASVANRYAGKNILQMPFLGTAMVAGYNLPTLAAGDSVVLDGETLARIYLGEIRYWNDSAIAALNTGLNADGKLPGELIRLGAYSDGTLEVTQVFGNMMCNFSSAFNAAYESVGRNLTQMPPRADGRMNITTGHTAQALFVANTEYSLAYMDQTYALRNNVIYARMVNKAGNTVSPTVDAIRTAMEAGSSNVQNGSFTLDITNADQPDSWPMSYLLYVTLSTNLTNPVTGCPSVKELLNILFWTQTNTAAVDIAGQHSYSILPVPLFRLLLDAFPIVQCNNRKSFSTAAVVGLGAPLAIYPSWANEQSSNTEVFKYYSTSSEDSVSNMVQGFTDFGGLDVELTAQEAASMPDVAVVPMVAYAVSAAYSVDVFAYGALRFDLPTLADIYLGNIKYWNDSRIATLNVNLTSYLPAAPICVIYQTNPSIITQLFTTVLANRVPRFAEKITPGMQVTFPDLNPCSIGVNGNIMDAFAQPNSIGMWIVPDIIPSLYAGPSFVVTESGGRAAPQPARDIIATMQEYADPLPDPAEGIFKLEGRGNTSWPFVVGSSVMIHTRPTDNCDASTALLDWIWWTQTEIFAIEMADNYGMAVASANEAVKRRILNTLASVRCDGVATFSLAGCVFNGTFCSDRGTCTNGVCVCQSGFDGDYCEKVASSDDSLSTGAVLGIVLGVLIPLMCLLLIVVPLIVIAVVLLVLRLTKRKPEWEINPDEVELGEPLGMGGYGSVYKARWRGTEVAVKMLPSHNPSKEMIKNFCDEIHVMMALRHPNVVLFMAASTSAEKMCLVMEFMALGSLFDVLHNELIPDIPFALKVKLAYQAAKGMHFLHSSGIVHRDLKSLNLLLDAKWNVKVSDFGLTRLKQEIKTGREGGNEGLGSIPWTAPEVLNDQPQLDYVLADVYSFGIILWELLTRSQPYPGLSPAAVAVAVIRDDARPQLPDDDGSFIMTPEYDELMRSCWHSDPSIRPTFLEIVTRLSSLTGEMSSSSQGGSSSSAASAYNLNLNRSHSQSSFPNSLSTSSKRTHTRGKRAGSAGSAGSADSSAAGSMYNYPLAMMRTANTSATTTAVRVVPPTGAMAIVFSDITSAASLWEFDAEAMKDATLAHNQLLRRLLAQHRGYEVRSARERNSGEGSFCLAFQEAGDAVAWCVEAQTALLEAVEWPPALLGHPGAAEEWGDTDDRVLYKGLRVRMGLHWGEPRMGKDPTTRRMEYYGPTVNAAARITAMSHGGQVVLSDALRVRLLSEPKAPDHLRMLDLGKFEMHDSPNGMGRLYEVKVPGLEGRFFGGVATQRQLGADEAGDGADNDGDPAVQTAVGEGLTNEDRFLNSANLCRWVINFNEVHMGKQIGMGSYGVVYKGTWKGVEVAVKRFIKQNLDERRLLEFRAEMAFLSELHHPNIVLFIGACVRMPNLCIVTEFVRQGCLKDILGNRSVKLTWQQRLRMLKSAALGVNYLHSLQPCIIHRDLKPSNLLVDENWNVKIADFGFARIKEENATMTRCGTPCWTAPEVIRGEKYAEKADVYSFGIIMWEMLTRKQPFAGRNFMGVSLDVLEGRRPQMPSDCPEGFRQMVERCWHAKADKRPAMDELLDFFDSLIGETSRGLNAV